MLESPEENWINLMSAGPHWNESGVLAFNDENSFPVMLPPPCLLNCWLLAVGFSLLHSLVVIVVCVSCNLRDSMKCLKAQTSFVRIFQILLVSICQKFWIYIGLAFELSSPVHSEKKGLIFNYIYCSKPQIQNSCNGIFSFLFSCVEIDKYHGPTIGRFMKS